jgi:glycosyltransferase involved in cell wall biosynthesis
MALKMSVVTVCRDSARTIADTLASVNAQTHPDIEHVVIDGGSADGTQQLVQSQARRLGYFVSEPDRGIYDAMNKGFEAATGDVVGFLNADDVFATPESAARIAAAFEAGVDCCYGDVVYVDADEPSRVIRYWRAGPYVRGQCATGWAPPHPTLYVRREAMLGCGGFDARMRIAADFEFALRLLDVAGLTARYVPEVLVRMRAGGASNRSLKNILQGHRELATALRRHGLPAGWAWSARRILHRVPQLLRRPS